MYRLIYFKATNISGFISGIGKKTFELDLSEFQDKDLIVIFGDNASGKSTFLSLVHPWHLPTDGRTKFVAPRKEGTLIRGYKNDDGTIISTKCVYKPLPIKSDADTDEDPGHSAKCFLEVTKPGEKPIEMNPTGNVTSYISLLYTYFGITKDFIGFATYNTAVSDIVKMTDTERKNSIGTLIPNTKKFTVGFNILNEKYKELRSLIRNISQKILHLRDEESLRSDLERITSEVERYIDDREDHVKKLAKAEGRLKELTRGTDVDIIIEEYNKTVASIEQYDHGIMRAQSRIFQIYDQLGIEHDDNSIKFDGIDNIQNTILKYDRKVTQLRADSTGYADNIARLTDELFRVENEIEENQSVLFSIKTQDVHDLEKLLNEYHQQLDGLRYTSRKKEFSDMSYDEAIGLSRVINMLDTMIQALYDEYGEMVTDYFSKLSNDNYEEHQLQSIATLHASIETNNNKKNEIYRKLIEMEQYRKFQSVLEQRPKTCTIDTCPFIANALKWSSMANEIEELKQIYEGLEVEIKAETAQVSEYEQRVALYNDAQTLIQYLNQYEPLIRKYYHIDLNAVYDSIRRGMWAQTLDIMTLKDIAAILSEKDLYIKITTQLIPEAQHAIDISKLYGTNRDLIQSQLDRLSDDRKQIKHSLDEYKLHAGVNGAELKRYTKRLSNWMSLSDEIQDYTEMLNKRIAASTEAEAKSDNIQLIRELRGKAKNHRRAIEDLDELIAKRNPIQQQLKLDLLSLDQLKLEKLTVEQDFLVVDILKSILQPGKGLRKELINIYMYDIYQVANQLLLHTFNGNLYLQKFRITDKEFTIPYVYNGTEGNDIITASASQQTAISIAISMAILSKILADYGIVGFDEADAPFSPSNREVFIDILTTQMRYIGVSQAFFITQNPEDYESYDVGFLCFPGGKLKKKGKDIIEIS